MTKQQIPLHPIPMENSAKVAAPFVARRTGNIVGVEANTDARFRNAILAGAPEQARKHFRDAFLNGPKADGGKHTYEYFGGAEKIAQIQSHIVPLVEVLHLHMATKLRLDGFNDWLTITGWGDDYRFIKGLMAWADMAEDKAEDATV